MNKGPKLTKRQKKEKQLVETLNDNKVAKKVIDQVNQVLADVQKSNQQTINELFQKVLNPMAVELASLRKLLIDSGIITQDQLNNKIVDEIVELNTAQQESVNPKDQGDEAM